MIKYEKLAAKPGLFKSFTGLTRAAFAEVLPAFSEAYEIALQAQEAHRENPRQRQAGGGRPATLDSRADQLVFILVYFRFYPVQVLQGFLFGMGQPQANEWIHRLSPVLASALGAKQQLPARRTRDLTTILAACPDLEFIIDGTERPIRRPQQAIAQKENYSGKKKRPTVKNIILTQKKTGKIKGLSDTSAGKKHDKKLADEQDIVFPPGSKLWKDTGFQGYEPPHTTPFQPTKKPKGNDLTADQKTENAQIARQRIGVEHSLAGVKVYAIARETFRNFRPGFADSVIVITCGLHNLRRDFPLTA